MPEFTTALLPDKCGSEYPNNGAWKQHLGNWGTYAVATGAALAMSTNASAGIISSTVDLTVSVAGQQTAPFNVGGNGELLVNHSFAGDSFRFASAVIAPDGVPLNFKQSTASGFVKRYTLGQPILAAGSNNQFALLLANETCSDCGGQPVFGHFGPGASQGFLGFLNSSGDLGWLQVKVTISGGFPSQLELISWGYNDVAGAPINAGQTGAAPEPGTLALSLLALGAAGILALRRRRKELAANNADLKF